MKWSKYQKALFKDVAEGSGHTVVEAVAGSGKTTSLLESLNHIPDGKTWLLVAFNKKIASELKDRAPGSCFGDVRTLHSLGLKTIYSRFPKVRVDNDKMRHVLDKVVGRNKKLWDLKAQISKTVTLCKGYLVDGSEFIDHIMDNHDIDTCEIDRDRFIDYVQKAMDASRKETTAVDFNDMIWFCYVYNLSVEKYDRVFIDEAQDLNNGQVALALKACKKTGRILALGDRKQCLYAFAGASLYSMDNIKKKLRAKELPLSITYRCPKLVVEEAQRFAPQIEAAPGAPDGIVKKITRAKMIKQAKPGCFILSRANAPLIGLALGFIRNSIPAIIQGRDIGQNLLTLIRKSRRRSLDSFLTWLDNWEKKETARLRKKKMNPATIHDKAACMRALADACYDLNDVKNKIKILFEDTDEHGKIVLSTVHKAKGLERNIVYMLMPTFKTHTQEERNIFYVAQTRAAAELYYVG
jgi:superfamily I DNA/RNA helicase